MHSIADGERASTYTRWTNHNAPSRTLLNPFPLRQKHEISSATYYAWKSKCGGLSASELKRLKELEAENTKLKRL